SPLQPTALIFPYSTLFRSGVQSSYSANSGDTILNSSEQVRLLRPNPAPCMGVTRSCRAGYNCSASNIGSSEARVFGHVLCMPARSEEHTSELQSRENLVCR